MIRRIPAFRSRPVAAAVICALVTSLVPVEALAATRTSDAPTAQEEVRVNRSTPRVTAAPLAPVFSDAPSVDELTRARVFAEPLLPLGLPSAAENSALAQAVRAYLAAGARDRVAPFLAFLTAHRHSPWRASLLTNIGIAYRRTGRFSRALDAWNEAWSLAKDLQDRDGRAVADRALGELFMLNAGLGRFDVLERMFEEIDGREVRGSATERISGARQALWAMHNMPEVSFRCGPEALDHLLRAGRSDYVTPEPVKMCPSTKQGTSLAQLEALAATVGTSTQIAYRPAGAEVILPAVVHWKVGHFGALIERNGDHVLLRDATMGEELWMSVAALDEEASGYFLVNDQPLPRGWRVVADEEGQTIWGKGIIQGPTPDDQGDGPECGSGLCGGGGGSGGAGGNGPRGPGPVAGRGMAAVSVHMMLISIIVRDTPIWYTPARGPAVDFQVRYNQREHVQPQTFYYSNLGPKWTFDWLSYIEDDPANASAPVKVYRRGGGVETSNGYDPATQRYATSIRSQAVVRRTSPSPIRYERELPDGSIEVFAQPDGAQTLPRKVFMTEWRDPQGNALTFTYDAQLRLVAATDATGQVTTVSYELPADPLKITKVTDPFNRTALFAYDAQGRLERVTDLLGLQSSFVYTTGDRITAVTTPYGTTTLEAGEQWWQRWVEIMDPAGGRERLMYGQFGNTSPPAIPSNQMPAGATVDTLYLNFRTTLHWDKRAMAAGAESPAAATEYAWTKVLTGSNIHVAAAGPHSIKRPLENRVWFHYWGGGHETEGTIRKPASIMRVLDDGTTQHTRHEYNSRGSLTKTIDPLGRETVYEYAANGLDLVTVKQKNGAGWDILETRTYNSQHEPLTITDAAGQTTTSTYNAAGQVLTVTNAKSETTTYAYDTNGRLLSITGPVTGATTTFTYDALSRVRTVTDADNYTVTTDYDAAGRVTRTTYPDSTYDENVYDKLDVVRRRDRLGRITHFFYDAARRLTATRDPLGRTVTQEWCACGSLDALVDANGNRTKWERDTQGRVAKEIRADGRQTVYAYENTTSRLKSVTDAKNQVTTYTYFRDDRLQGMAYTNEQIATPDVSFTYDSVYGRLLTMLDGTGTTTYGYHAIAVPPGPGATRLGSVDGPLTNDTITYSYDQLGRVIARAINGVGVTWTFDALGRTTTEVNSLGTFTYVYDGPTNRLTSVAYPNGQTSEYTHYSNAPDHRLQTIHHKYPNWT